MSLTMHSVYSAVLNGTTIPYVKRQKLDSKVEKMMIDGGGKIDPTDLAIAFQESQYQIQTPAINTVVALLTGILTGKACSSGAILQYQTRSDGGFASGSSHITFTSPLGFLMLEYIEATQDENQPAMLSAIYDLLISGGVVVTPDIAASLTGSPSLAVKYALGPVTINGVIYENTKSRFETGGQFKPTRSGGQTVAATGAVKKREPKFIFDFKDSAIIDTFGIGMSEAPGTIAMYLRKIDADGDRVADATTEHIKISATVGKIITTQLDGGDGDDDAVCSMEAYIKAGATVAFSAASAMPS
jgi:hypothetical protein